MKKNAFIIVGILVVIGIVGVVISMSGGGTGGDTITQTAVEKPLKKPLNISIYLDLSNRLAQATTPSQAERDIAIVGKLASIIKDRAIKQRILPCQDRIKVFFYPAPNDPQVALLSEQLELDLSKTEMKQKKVRLMAFEQEFARSLKQIYQSTLQAQNWVGSDIWGFFNKAVDTYCIRPDYRNILVVLTDGYLYHMNNLQQEGTAFSYITNNTLANPQATLLNGRNKPLENIEVYFLEVSPTRAQLEPRMEQVLNDWLHSMGVQKCYVGETDLPANTYLILERLLEVQ